MRRIISVHKIRNGAKLWNWESAGVGRNKKEVGIPQMSNKERIQKKRWGDNAKITQIKSHSLMIAGCPFPCGGVRTISASSKVSKSAHQSLKHAQRALSPRSVSFRNQNHHNSGSTVATVSGEQAIPRSCGNRGRLWHLDNVEERCTEEIPKT